jgi:hypothetical protein
MGRPLDATLSGLGRLVMLTQGSSLLATVGWAEGSNPVGIHPRNLRKALRLV